MEGTFLSFHPKLNGFAASLFVKGPFIIRLFGSKQDELNQILNADPPTGTDPNN